MGHGPSAKEKATKLQEVSARLRRSEHRLPYGFADVSKRTGVPTENTPTWGSAWIDLAADGYPDLLLNRHKREAWWLQGDRDGFTTSKSTFDELLLSLPKGRSYYDRHSCAWGESNGDGRPDLYCVAGAQKGIGEGPNRLLGSAGAGFRDISRAAGVQDLFGRGRTVNWLDYDSDGDLDLYVGNEVRAGYPNVLFRNDGASFTSVASRLSMSIATMDSAWGDFDLDGDPDLLVAGNGERGSAFMRNDEGTFIETYLEGVTGKQWDAARWADFDADGAIDLVLVREDLAAIWRNNGTNLYLHGSFPLEAGNSAALFDIDNDGDLDLYVVQGAPRNGSLSDANLPDLLFVNRGGSFARASSNAVPGPQVGSGESVSVSDFDRDGRLDLLITNGYLEKPGPTTLLRNISRTGNWAAIQIHGDPKNPLGFGAVVRVRTSQGTAWQFVTDQMSFHSQSEVGYLHLGLGLASAGRVRVKWPDGSKDCFSIEAAETIELHKGSWGC